MINGFHITYYLRMLFLVNEDLQRSLDFPHMLWLLKLEDITKRIEILENA